MFGAGTMTTHGGNDTSVDNSWHCIGQKHVPDFSEALLGGQEVHLLPDTRQQFLQS